MARSDIYPIWTRSRLDSNVAALSSKPQAAYTSLRADVFLQSCIRIYIGPGHAGFLCFMKVVKEYFYH